MKKKKSLIALAVIAIIGVIGGTFAYYTNSETFTNIFKTKPYSTEFTEEFVSPENWTPGTVTSKKVIAKNTGSVDVAVRVSYEENWTAKDGSEIENEITAGEDGTESAAIINFDNTTDWTKASDGYYYYAKMLGAGETTNSFIKSVTFNNNVAASINCQTVGNTKTCTSDGTGYDGATYTLTIKIETIQADAVEEAWPDAPSNSPSPR